MLILDLIRVIPDLLRIIIPSNRSIIFFNTSKKTKEIIHENKIQLSTIIAINKNWQRQEIYDKITFLNNPMKINMIYNKVNNYILRQLKKLIKKYKITELDIESCKINAIETLSNKIKMCPRLTRLNLCNNNFKYNKIEILLKGLETLKSLKHINLSHNFSDEDENNKSELLGQLFENYPLLEDLNLNNIKFSFSGFTILTCNISKYQKLKCIELQSCVREPEAIISFINILPQFKKLIKINLSSNKINCEIATQLATVLSNCTSLEHIDLCINNIGPKGAISIANVLPSLTSLNNLDLRYNNVRLEGAEYIFKSIINCPSLIHFYLNGNNIGPERLTNKMYFKVREDCPFLTHFGI